MAIDSKTTQITERKEIQNINDIKNKYIEINDEFIKNNCIIDKKLYCKNLNEFHKNNVMHCGIALIKKEQEEINNKCKKKIYNLNKILFTKTRNGNYICTTPKSTKGILDCKGKQEEIFFEETNLLQINNCILHLDNLQISFEENKNVSLIESNELKNYNINLNTNDVINIKENY